MENAKTLVRSVVRAFYNTRDVLVIDILVSDSAVRDDDLAHKMGMNTKDVHKLCAKLRDDRLLSVGTRPELREGQQRPINRTYYYINYHHTIDAIKWRIYQLDRQLQGPVVPASERKEYVCPRCGAEWTQMQVLDKFDSRGFICQRCGEGVLVHDVERSTEVVQASTKMHSQLRFITDLLQELDEQYLEENTFDLALEHARPVVRDAVHASLTNATVPLQPSAVKGQSNTGPTSIAVTIGAVEEDDAAKAKVIHDLPDWFQHDAKGQKVVTSDTKEEQDDEDEEEADFEDVV
jgi:transcription initiation factor TFIIE subunit alpha